MRNHCVNGAPFPSGYDRFGFILRPGPELGTNDFYYATSSFPGGSRQFIRSFGGGNVTGTCGGGGGGSPPPPRFNITGYVWVDTSGGGGSGRASNEPYYTGSLTVSLYNSSGNLVATTNTNAGTDGPYLFSGFLAGSYSVRITPPANYIATTATSQAVRLGPDESGVNFGIVPVYDISGSVFNDLNRNLVKDAGEGKNWTQPPATFSITGTTWRLGGAVSVNATTGTFTVTNTLAGTKTIRYTAGLPVDFENLHPGTGSNPQFSVTVGPGCTYTPLHRANTVNGISSRATCNARGDMSNLNFVITRSIPWRQTIGLDVRMDNGIRNVIPPAPLYPAYSSIIDDN